LKRNNLLILGLVCLFLFAVVTFLVFENITQASDARLELLLNSDLGGAVTTLMVDATLYGREDFWIPIVIVMFVLGKRDTKLMAIELAALFIVGIAAGDLLKYVAYRPRPIYTISVVARVAFETDSSFPPPTAMIVPSQNHIVAKSRPRASTSPWLPSLFADHQAWFNDPRFDGSFPSRVLPFLYLGNL